MTKKLEEAFDLRPMKEAIGEDEVETEEVITETPQEKATRIVKALSTAEKIDHSLTLVDGLDDHDSEMDYIAQEALEAYVEFKELGANQADAHSARMMEVAATMLKTALEAKDAKTTRKIKMLELQLKKLKLEQDAKKIKGKVSNDTDDGIEFDRNDLLRRIRED